jgi:hypothetical protein
MPIAFVLSCVWLEASTHAEDVDKSAALDKLIQHHMAEANIVVGHGGNDPGLQTDMRANLSRDVGMISFMDTSVTGDDSRAARAIFDAVWAHAEDLRRARDGAGAPR